MFSCGNDLIEGMETCDGTDLGGEDCISQGFDEGTLACLGDCSGFDTSGCNSFMCGNDLIEGTEVCDGTDLNGLDCGNFGFPGGTLQCSPTCGSFDTSNCITEVCGNNFTEGAEVCDGTDLGAEDCLSLGFSGGLLDCLGDCSGYDTSSCSVCGDNAIGGAELCDGTDLGGQTCVTQGFAGGTLGCNVDCLGFDTSACTVATGSDCCIANGTPGCDDLACQTAMCALDPFCCSNSWDAICAGNAPLVCGPCAGAGCTHPVCEAGVALVSGCDPCVTSICAVDAFCCSTSWDSICVGQVNTVCGLSVCP